jgi:cyclophilin family peptidyl-prolyl cis-trans isomerase
MYRVRYGIVVALMLMLAACGTPTSTAGTTEPAATAAPAAPAMTIDPNKTYTAVIETTKGTMQANLFAKEAPITVNNFVFLARDGFYNNVKFHRIMKGFMVQTGDPQGDGTGGPGYQFEDEPVTRDYTRGIMAMANSGPNTNGSQFFIMHEDYGLQPNYTIFGEVTEGLETLDAIANVPVSPNPMTGEESVPDEEVLITSVTIEEQ